MLTWGSLGECTPTGPRHQQGKVALIDSLVSLPQHVDAARFLTEFFRALEVGDWPDVEPRFHPSASVFSLNPASNIPSSRRWEVAAPLLQRWIDAGPHSLRLRVEDLELSVTNKSAIVTLPSRNARNAGARVMVLTLDKATGESDISIYLAWESSSMLDS
jgi:hypothetical protein